MPAAIVLGDPLPYTIRLINPGTSVLAVRVNLSIAAIDYIGTTLTNLAAGLSGDFEVPPGQVRELAFALPAAEYWEVSAISELVEARLGVVEVSTLEGVATERRTGLARPSVVLRLPPNPVHAGEEFGVSAAWTNQWGHSVTTAALRLSFRGVETLPDVWEGFGVQQPVLEAGDALQTGTNLIGQAAGHVLVRANVTSPDMVQVDESRLMQVGPELRLEIEPTVAGQVALAFPALSGRRYALESRGTASGSGWQPLGAEILGHGTNAVVSISSAGQTRFFRVRALPQ